MVMMVSRKSYLHNAAKVIMGSWCEVSIQRQAGSIVVSSELQLLVELQELGKEGRTFAHRNSSQRILTSLCLSFPHIYICLCMLDTYECNARAAEHTEQTGTVFA